MDQRSINFKSIIRGRMEDVATDREREFVVDGDFQEALSPTTPNSSHHPAPRATGVERLHRSLGCLAA